MKIALEIVEALLISLFAILIAFLISQIECNGSCPVPFRSIGIKIIYLIMALAIARAFLRWRIAFK